VHRSLTGPAEAALLSNKQIAERLAEVADLLERKGENPYKVRAYREGAETVRGLGRPAHEVLREGGRAALRRLPGIGKGLARAVEELALTGRLTRLDELRGEVDPDALLGSVGGLGPALARRVRTHLGVTTLEGLEQAAHDGRLAQVPGLGPRRVQAVRESLAARLGRRRRHAEGGPAAEEPPVEELLSVDEEYRRKAAAGELRLIAPRRFNPTGEARLPVLRTRRGERRYTALYSNTAQAHRKGATRDWVVIYLRGPGGEDQWTVVTTRAGRRVVRGREKECRERSR